MRVFTYHENISELKGQTELLELWKTNWAKAGFDPVILGRSDAQLHPFYDTYLATVTGFPTVNPKQYEIACFMRWLAMAQAGGGLMVDTDVMVYLDDSEPFDFQFGRGMVFFCRHVPCAVYGNANSYFRMCRMFREYTVTVLDQENNQPHISDMHIIHNRWRRNWWLSAGLCVQAGDAGWEYALFVHYPFAVCGRDKVAGINRLELEREKLLANSAIA